MSNKISKLLFLPFFTKALAKPRDGHCYGYFNAQILEEEGLVRDSLLCVQPNRSGFLRLSNAGYQVATKFDDRELSGALLACDKHKRLNETNFIAAWNACLPGSPMVVAGLKKQGIASFKKFAAQFAPVESQMAKHHGLVFWLRKPFVAEAIPVPDFGGAGGYFTGPGMFSAEKIDKGSKLLAEHFSERIQGNVADLGAGWGYLSIQLLAAANSARQVDLYESNWDALQAARKNVVAGTSNTTIEYHWKDVTCERPMRRYDWVIMNPPFHSGVKGEPDLGKLFIEAAHRMLSTSGQLLMVANQHLPYERTLKDLFSKSECLEVRDGFKVIQART